MKALKRILMDPKGAKQAPTENEPRPPKKQRNVSRLPNQYVLMDSNESAAKVIAEGALKQCVFQTAVGSARRPEERVAAARSSMSSNALVENHVRSQVVHPDGFGALPSSHLGSRSKETEYKLPHLWLNITPTESLLPPQQGLQVDFLGMRADAPDALQRHSADDFRPSTDLSSAPLTAQADIVMEPSTQQLSLSSNSAAHTRTQAPVRPFASLSSIVDIAMKQPVPLWCDRTGSAMVNKGCEGTSMKILANSNDYLVDLSHPTQRKHSRGGPEVHQHERGMAVNRIPSTAPQWVERTPVKSPWYRLCGNDDPVAESEDSIWMFVATQWKYLPRQPQYASESVAKARRMLVTEWVMQVHAKYNMQCETLFHAIGCFDRYFSSVKGGLPVPANFLQLIGLCCLMIAAKFQETTNTLPHMSEWRGLVTRPYTTGDILAAEVDILEILEFRIAPPNPALFLRHLCLECTVSLKSQFYFLCQYYLEATLLDSTYLTVMPEERAFIAFQSALRHTATNSYLVTKERFRVALKARLARFTIELSEWCDALLAHVQMWRPAFLISKYSTDRYCNVSRLEYGWKITRL
eukprot:GEMP01030636.1.p1 GENE.GEMP01030636.1~~GEMP01030636.1.p1  ORF type:complete len:580 (+),score=109.48 GEMP01030636.1:102-1841(+)